MKIVYCTDTICRPGGIQIVTMAKANALAEIEGNKVWIIVTEHSSAPIAWLSEKVHLVNLDIYNDYDWSNIFFLLKGMLMRGQIYKKRIMSVLKSISPDIVISTGTSEKHFIPSLKVSSNPVFFREIHFEKKYRMREADSLSRKLVMKIGDLYDFHYKIKKYDKIAVLTQEDKDTNWKGWKSVIVMPNPITAKHNLRSSNDNKIVIAAGRLVKQKNFTSLIRIWNKVINRHPDWVLQIWGIGEQQGILEQLIAQNCLQSKVKLMGYTNELLTEMQKSSIFALSSDYEGFPLVTLEAMSVGIPVVSYSCPTGPKDLINNGEDGYLIPLGDENQFAEKICFLIENQDVLKRMGQNAILKSNSFSIDCIVNKWMGIFRELRDNKQQ